MLLRIRDIRGESKMKKKKDVSEPVKFLLGIIAFIIFVFPGLAGWYILLDSTGVIDDIVYGSHIPSKEESFQMVYENQEELEVLVEDVGQILQSSGRNAISVTGKLEFKKNKLTHSVLKEYPIKDIAANSIGHTLQVVFTYRVDSNVCQGVYYVSDDAPDFWGEYEEKDIEEKNGVYTKRGPYYIYETEKITEHWYYYNVKMW